MGHLPLLLILATTSADVPSLSGDWQVYNNIFGNQRLSAGDGPLLATRRADRSLAVAAWNLPTKLARQGGAVGMGTGLDPIAHAKSEMDGEPLRLILRFVGLNAKRAKVTAIDMLRGSALPAWQALGSPEYPTAAEVAKLRDAASKPAAESIPVHNNDLTIELPPSGLALVEVDSHRPQ